jgi:hypothetical protein
MRPNISNPYAEESTSISTKAHMRVSVDQASEKTFRTIQSTSTSGAYPPLRQTRSVACFKPSEYDTSELPEIRPGRKYRRYKLDG